jgi:hypothetical protein
MREVPLLKQPLYFDRYLLLVAQVKNIDKILLQLDGG